jgi:hypothetical protein
MRTTLTLEDDVAAELEKLRRARGQGWKDLVNEALRHGMRQMTSRARKREPFRTKSVSGGRVFVSIDNIADVLAATEGESFK